jgi:hypothetical protein
MRTFQTPMGVAPLDGLKAKALFPPGPEGDFQETIGLFECMETRYPHLLHQAVLQRAEQPFDASLRLR